MAKRKKRAAKRGPRPAPPRALTTRRAKLTELHIDPANARKHGKRNLETIRGSLKRFGQVEPLVVQRGTGRVIGGNGRLEVMLADGETHADVVEVDADDAKAAALGIALNRTAELAEWDVDVLGTIAPTLDTDVLADIGFDVGELDGLIGIPDVDLGSGQIEEKVATRRLAVFIPVDDQKAKRTIEEAARAVGGHVAECTNENCNVSVRDLDPNTWARRRVQLGAQTASQRKDRGSESQDGEGG